MAKGIDGFFKLAMSNTHGATEFFEAHLPKQILQKIDLNTLDLTSHSFIDKALQAEESDLVYTIKMNNRPAIIYLLCEHHSIVEWRMALRLWSYILRLHNVCMTK